MRKIRTISSKHNELIGKYAIIKRERAQIIDTTETDTGTIYIAVKSMTIYAMYTLEGIWHKLDEAIIL